MQNGLCMLRLHNVTYCVPHVIGGSVISSDACRTVYWTVMFNPGYVVSSIVK